MQHRDGDALAVGSRREQAPRDVVRRVVTARDRLPLPQDPLARRKVEVERLARRGHRGVGEAQDGRREGAAAFQREAVGLLREGDRVFLAAIERANDDPRQALVPLLSNEVIGIDRHAGDHAALLVRHDVDPVRHAGRGQRRAHDLVILGAVGVGADEELVAAMRERVAQILGAGLHAEGRSGRVAEVEQMALGGGMVADPDHREGAGDGPLQPDEPAGIVLGEHQLVVDAAEPMAVDLAGAMVCIDTDVVEAGAVVHPDDRAVGVDDDVVGVEAGREVADADDVQLGACRVGAPGELAVIGRGPGFVDAEEGAVAPLGIAVEHDLLDAVLARLAAEERLLAALAMTRVVEPRPVGDGHRGIVLLHAAAHLRDERVDQLRGRVQVRRRIRILRLEHGPDRRGQGIGVAQDVAPIVGAQPGVIVADRDAVDRALRRVPIDRGRPEDRPRRRRR